MAPTDTTPKLVSGPQFAKALEAAGIISDLDSIERVIIEICASDVVRIHVQRIGDVGDERLEAARHMSGYRSDCCDTHLPGHPQWWRLRRRFTCSTCGRRCRAFILRGNG
jgi:hypothetical protein